MKKYARALFVIVTVLIAVSVIYRNPKEKNNIENKTLGDFILIDTVQYQCDNNKTITAAYYSGPEAPEPIPGNPPTPTGKVEVSFDGSEVVSLEQTISASGIRYANDDESLVFWSKGDEALVMRNNSMDLTYTNCRAAKQ